MHRSTVAALLVCFIPLVASAATVEERIEALEKRDAELYHTLEEKKSSGLVTKPGERFSVAGLLEGEGAYERVNPRTGATESSSDLVLATAQISFGTAVTEHLEATLVVLFEEDETDPPDVDEAYIRYARSGWTGRFGRQYLPFGEYYSHFISDPLTLELGEARETAVLVGYAHDLFSLSAFGFNGDAVKVNPAGDPEDDHIKDWGMALKITPGDRLAFGASVLSNFVDTNTALAEEFHDRVAGWSAFAVAALGPIEVSGEVLGSIGSFDAADLDVDGNGSGDRPRAWNLEAAWDALSNVELALRLEGSRHFAGAPRLQYGANVSWSPWGSVSLSLEYLRGQFDEAFGQGLASRDRITTQLAVEF